MVAISFYSGRIITSTTEKPMVKLSKTSKLDGILSWSLQAKDDCPGAVGAKGELVDACTGCYARTGFYVFSKAVALRAHNKADWQRDGWVDDMVQALAKQKYFRWFDSGDMYALPLAKKILAIMEATPHCQHWLPTRMVKFAKFGSTIAKMQALPNVMVRFSSDSISGEFDNRHGSTIIPDVASAPAGVTVCMAYEHEGKCNGCRACWNRSVPVIAYPAHGKTMKKIIRINQEK
jgi:hypothetical protein